MRGRMVEVERGFEPIDEGELCITSSRAVYTGNRKTIEMPYTKLLDLNVYTDTIQVHLSNRQNPPTFRVANGPMVAAADQRCRAEGPLAIRASHPPNRLPHAECPIAVKRACPGLLTCALQSSPTLTLNRPRSIRPDPFRVDRQVTRFRGSR